MAEEKKIFSDEEKESIIQDIYAGEITVESLDENMYNQIAEYLMKGITEGYGSDFVQLEYGTPDYEMLEALQENIYLFSGAKTYQQTKDMSELMLDEDGNRVSFEEFKELADQTFDNYNEAYLEAEYNTAIASARNASAWVDFEKNKDVYSQLEWKTADDELTCEICGDMNGIVLDKDDPFWDENGAPAHFNCRCLIIEVEGKEESTEEDLDVTERSDEFQNNSGKTGQVFDSDHPYFNVPKEDEAYAERNFDLSIPNEGGQDGE